MKKSLFVAAIAALAVVACKKTEVVDTTDGMDTVVAPVDTMNNMQDSASMNVPAGDSLTVEGPAAVTVETPAVEVK